MGGMKNTGPARIVVIDDNRDHLQFVTTLLARAGHKSAGFASARYALDFMRREPIELVITEIFMPDMDGFELMRIMRRHFPKTSVLTLSGGRPIEKDFYLQCAKHLGAVAALRKPCDPDALRALVEQLLPRRDGENRAGAPPSVPETATEDGGAQTG